MCREFVSLFEGECLPASKRDSHWSLAVDPRS